MAVTFDSKNEVVRGSSYWFDTSDIDIDAENNGRHVLPDIKWLVESIKQYGQKTPCLIRKNGKRACMVEGHSRWRAICQINQERKPAERLKVWCTYFEGNEVDALVSGFISNRERNALQPVDEGYFVARMQSFGKTLEEIAAVCHEDVAWCKGRLAYVRLTPAAQKLASEGNLKPSAAKALADLSAQEQKRYLESGAALTPRAIKQSAQPVNGNGSAPEKRKRVSVGDLREVLRKIAENGDYPTPELQRRCAEPVTESAVDDLCVWLMEFIDGK